MTDPELLKENLRYQYPYGIDLRPNSALHKQLVNRLADMARDARAKIKRRFSQWRQIEEKMTLFIPRSERDAAVRSKDRRKPTVAVLPTMYAALDALKAAIALDMMQYPIIRCEHVSSEDRVISALLELELERQHRKTRTSLAICALVRDSLVYGYGASAVDWCVVPGYRTELVPIESAGMEAASGRNPSVQYQRESIPYTKFEGNRLTPIDPYHFLWDVNVPVERVQEGEFCGWSYERSHESLLRQEQTYPELFFNARYLKAITGESEFYDPLESSRDKDGVRDQIGTPLYSTQRDKLGPYGMLNLFVDLIPADWGLGGKKDPEKWQFVMAGDKLILQAYPLMMDHNMFPVITASPDTDNHGACPVSRLEAVYGTQETGDFIYNSRVQEIRRALYGMWIINTNYFDSRAIHQMLNPAHGAVIPIRAAYGGNPIPLDQIVTTMPVTNVTANMMQDSLINMQQMQTGSGATSTFQGAERQTSAEVSATESSQWHSGGMMRLSMYKNLFRDQVFPPFGEQCVSNTRQFLSQDTWVKVAGRRERELRAEFGGDRAMLTPTDLMSIRTDLDIFFHDHSSDFEGDTNSMVQAYQFAMQDPEIRQEIDSWRFTETMFRKLGWNDIHDYRRATGDQSPLAVATASSGAIDESVAKGDLVPA